MIQRFVDCFMEAKPQVLDRLKAGHPDEYADIVRLVVEHISDCDYGDPDPGRIHQIDDGGYQGTLVFVIAASGYQPDDYWYVKVGYGSCSGCDTLASIHAYSDDLPTPSQVADYWMLALHVTQGLAVMGAGCAE